MNILYKRYYWLRLILVLVIITFSFMGKIKIISYNFLNDKNINYAHKTNSLGILTVPIFDQNIIHNIEIKIDDKTYHSMINSYLETKEKDYFPINMTIDGTVISNVGIRLKGDYGLNKILNISRNTKYDSNLISDYLPFLIKFDEYVDGQSYQGVTELAIRRGGDTDGSLLAEILAYNLFKRLGQPAPSSAYSKVKVGNNKPQLYIISEILDEQYIHKHFSGDNGILYKAIGFSGFNYLGENPIDYKDKYVQKTSVNKDDALQLIDFLKFLERSSDEEFDNELESRVDINSFLYVMAIDSIIWNNDGFGNGRGNFYLYYHKGNKKFYLLSRDENLAFGQIAGIGNRKGPNRLSNNNGIFWTGLNYSFSGSDYINSNNNLFRINAGFLGKSINIFRDRILKSDKFKEKYQNIFSRVYYVAYEQSSVAKDIEHLSSIFLRRNRNEKLLDEKFYIEEKNNLLKTIDYIISL